MSDSVTQAGKDGGSAKRAPFRGTIPAENPPAADGGLSPEREKNWERNTRRTPRPSPRTEGGDGAGDVGAQKRRLPCDRSTNVVSGDHRLPGTESIDETHDV